MSESEHLTKTEVKEEILKCAKNPHYFINNYVRIENKESGQLIPFDTYDFQTDILEDFQNEGHNIILKPRQMGVSTLTAAHIAWHVLFHQYKDVLVVATKESVSTSLIKKAKNHIKRLPEWLQISEFVRDNINSFELANESQVRASSTAEDAGRSDSLSLLVIDEAAHIDNMDEIWGAVWPTLSETGGNSIVISTPKGVGNWFHEKYQEAEEGRNLFNPIQIDWQEHPDRDQEWMEEQRQNMASRKVAQEYECAFLASGHTAIDPDTIEKIEKELVEDPAQQRHHDRNLWIWEPPLHREEDAEDVRYYITADVARGDGKDYSAFHVLEANNFRQVAEYKGQIEFDLFAELLAKTGRMYGDCLIIVETNKLGYNVCRELRELSYPNIFYSEKSTNEQVPQHVAENSNKKSVIPGITTTQNNRHRFIGGMAQMVENDSLKIKSQRTVNEMRTFVWENGKPQAMEGYNDDLIMSLAIACWARDQVVIRHQNTMEFKKAALSGVSVKKKTFSTSFENQNNRAPAGVGPQVQRHSSKMEKKKEKAKERHKKYRWIYTG